MSFTIAVSSFHPHAYADQLPIPEHQMPAVDAVLLLHPLCEALADGTHALVEHAVTVAWANRTPSWFTLDLGHFHQIAQCFAYAELFHDAVHLSDIRHVETLASRVLDLLGAIPLLAVGPGSAPAARPRRWKAVLDTDKEIVSIAVADGHDGPEEEAEDEKTVWADCGNVVTLYAPDMRTAYTQLLTQLAEFENEDFADRVAAHHKELAEAHAATGEENSR
ncbi:hypothetical protein AB0D10_01285 [Kitasatospora sp. NPDC048545]|uniref:hypothetical protein n=1 Tax=Kitasatospora sp. NPDC048545 TaxID=3157208 RepID=UPI0033D283E8